MIKFIKRIWERWGYSKSDRLTIDVMEAIHALNDSDLIFSTKIKCLRDMSDYLDAIIENEITKLVDKK